MNKKEPTEQYKWIFCLLLLVWIRQTSTMPLLDDSIENFNDDVPGEEILDADIKTDDLGESQGKLKNSLHQHLNHLTHAELKEEHANERTHKPSLHSIEGNEDERNSSPLARLLDEHEDEGSFQTQQNRNADSSEASDNEDEPEFKYNPWEDSFQDQFEDGTYAYGYSLPNGVTRFERSFYSDKYKGLVVEGFYTQPRVFGKRKEYELRCYHVDPYSGYRLKKVQYMRRPPIVHRDEMPKVDCFDEQ